MLARSDSPKSNIELDSHPTGELVSTSTAELGDEHAGAHFQWSFPMGLKGHWLGLMGSIGGMYLDI